MEKLTVDLNSVYVVSIREKLEHNIIDLTAKTTLTRI